MNTVKIAAVIAALTVPVVSAAQFEAGADSAEADEVIVFGRSVSTSLAKVEVDREMLVDTATVLKDIPGANVNANGPITGIAQYRGMYGDRVAVSIDHMSVVSGGPNAMDTPLSYVSPMITQTVSVERGIPSVSAAPESIGGHVAAELSRGEFAPDRAVLSGFVGSRYSDNGDVSTSAARFTFASNRDKFSIIAESDTGNDLQTPLGTMRPSRLNRDRYDLSYARAGQTAELLVYAGRLKTADTGTPALPMDIRFIETDLAGGRLAIKASEKMTFEGRFAWNDVQHLMDNFWLREAPASAMQRQNLTAGEGMQVSVSGAIALSESTLTIGLDSISADHGAIISNPNNAAFQVNNFSDVERDVASVFAEWRRSGELMDIEIGARAKRIDTSAGEVGATGLMGMMAANVSALADAFNAANRDISFSSMDVVVKVVRRTDTGTEWRFEAAHKTRAPSYQELYLWLPLQATGGLADGRSYIGNLRLDEEHSNELTIGLGKQFASATISPQMFYKKVSGYIQGVPSNNSIANAITMMNAGQSALMFSNVDAELWGADIAWKIDITERVFVDGALSFVRGRRTDMSDNLYRLAPPNSSIGVTWQPENWSVTAELIAYAKQDKVAVFNGETPTSGYALSNLAINWEPGESLRVEARVDNLFDRAYQDHVAGINRAAGSDLPLGVRLYGTERTLSMGLIFSF